MTEELQEAVALMRRALDLIDRHGDPYVAGPHLDLAIDRLEQGSRSAASEGTNRDAGELTN